MAASMPYNLRSSTQDGKKQRLGLTEAPATSVAGFQKAVAKQHVTRELPPQEGGGERAYPIWLYCFVCTHHGYVKAVLERCKMILLTSAVCLQGPPLLIA